MVTREGHGPSWPPRLGSPGLRFSSSCGACAGAGTRRAAAGGSLPRARLPFMPTARALPPEELAAHHAELVGAHSGVAGRVKLGGEIGTQHGERTLRRNPPAGRPGGRGALRPTADRAAGAVVVAVVHDRAPLMSARAAHPPHLLVRARAERVGVKAAVARRVKLRSHRGVQDGERSLARYRSRGRQDSRARARRAATPLRAVRRGITPLLTAAAAAPPQLTAGVRPDRERVKLAVARQVKFRGELWGAWRQASASAPDDAVPARCAPSPPR